MPNAILQEKIIVVTGGAGLLGEAFCRAIAQQNGRAIIADLNISQAEESAARINADYPDCAQALEMNITDKTSIERAIEQLTEAHGRIDAVVNNAYPRNKNYGRRLEDVTFDDFNANMGMHLGGYFLVSQRFSAFFKTQGHGNIINMSSIYGVMAPRFEVYEGTKMTMPVEYAAIKSGVVHLTRYFAQYYKKDNIRVNAVSPGGIEDGQDEKFLKAYQQFSGTKGMLSPEDMASTVVFLLSDGSKYITGQNLIVDDGFSL